MTETLNIMEDYLRFREWRYCRIDGSVKVGPEEEGNTRNYYSKDPTTATT